MPNSRIITSNQAGIHDSLEPVVRRHLNSRFRRPYPDYSLEVFEQAEQRASQYQGNLILDSYCGVGESTVNLARQYPEALVIGIDKSVVRLAKHDEHYRQSGVDNYLLLRADVDDFWRLAVDANWQLARHCVFYPNPWPKSSQLKRRVHGSPLFPSLLALKGEVELRSNWPVYVQEFAAALEIAGFSAKSKPFTPEPVITPFERKYGESGQVLWRCICDLDRGFGGL
ncbi:tRNA (guanine(46)-N(7))-methyltransferase TrmB [Oceanicoccus sagamiensis]|uniref:tRNA (guanine(46)-N(7))-methyltransferase TrmB n=1 Tax=Oceanicoccus sagamiensis TaxID=716816 RepID=UPI001F0B50DA|nr:SAM-dependent methyltransferase [Oceanicoccus sagamiensis]